ncbi:DUF4352 domain-containing protein [Mycobacterium sp. KBS0706]|uniref:DUF4352 domain-containing protein n=1 Tax=Mycobacterium sp. KBS0706 TaxID=2578109 RepID=UPI00110FB2C2|nr:DUF4352 domain-containing protein [Mycobacterium sp. KBS0706]TSD90682.1 DUF4352 domain-containing protein [Mycobacterium sp. KBS0706]
MIRRLAQLAAMVVAAMLLIAMQRSTPSYDTLTGPIPVSGVSGETVTARSFTVRVDRVEFARRLQFGSPGFEKQRDTGGVWAIVTATLAARDATVTVAGAEWEGPTGTRYSTSDRLSGARALFPGQTLQPGTPVRGRFVFEIPADQMQGATLRVSQAQFPRFDSLLRISLDRGDGRALQIRDTLDLARPPLGLGEP